MKRIDRLSKVHPLAKAKALPSHYRMVGRSAISNGDGRVHHPKRQFPKGYRAVGGR